MGEEPLGVPIPDPGGPQDAARNWGPSLPSASVRMEACGVYAAEEAVRPRLWFQHFLR